MGWFRPMGVDTVEYHKETVLGRADDHPGLALDYYASRGETPLRWGGAVSARLGLVGEVTTEQYEAMYGSGGARDPLTGERLVNAKRPGFEIVIAAHKSTALLGVVGRAEDMHALLDVETTETMAYLERGMQATGGRRGRAATVTLTRGLAYATTRHGTSRAGDPSLHDHALIANVTEMLDAKGGFKALFSAVMRDKVEAATMVGRLNSAWKAKQLGYAIEHDDGPSGRLRHWRIVGIPQEACDKLSKRSDAIGEYLSDKGYVGYRARNAAARATREVKRGTGIEELQPRWEAELAEIGWPVERIVAALDAACHLDNGPERPLTSREIDQLTKRLMDPEGEFITRGKVFTRDRLVAEVAAELYGQDPAQLNRVLDRIIRSPLVVPLIGVQAAREPVYTAAAVLVNEQAIAACVERLLDADGPQLDPARVLVAVAEKQNEIGAELSDGQYRAIETVCTSGRAVDFVVGIAGSGKTTALDAAASALEAAGYTVIGTATSGQAARTLGTEAGVEARTMRSLLARLNRGSIVLGRDSVVILDEAGMTSDVDMARLLHAVGAAGSKVVIVGDDRQLSAVGPGGALHQVLLDHPEAVVTLTENLRQRSPAERDALLELRSGDIDVALEHYVLEDRITVGPDRTESLVGMVDAWVADTRLGPNTFLLAWQRANVEALNRLARDQARQHGWLRGTDMELPDGRLFAVGDLVVTLAPNYREQLVTSERAHVVGVDPDTQALTIETDHGRRVTLLGNELAADRLDHGYALTVHREQGATSDRTHYYADGGGRELAYVAMSRARGGSTVHVVADDLPQAVEQLRDDWSRIQHDTWITPASEVGLEPGHQPTSIDVNAVRDRYQAEIGQLRAFPPADVTNELDAIVSQLDDLRTQREDLFAGTGRYQNTAAGRAIRDLQGLGEDITHALMQLDSTMPWERRKWHRLIDTYEKYEAQRGEDWNRHGRPQALRLESTIDATEGRITELQRDQQLNDQWHRDHPEYAHRTRWLEQAICDLDTTPTPALSHGIDKAKAISVRTVERDHDPETARKVDTIAARLDRLARPAPALPAGEPPCIEPPDIGGIGL